MSYKTSAWNFSAWSLRHPAMIAYLMVVLSLAGAMSYFKLGRAEDPDFTFKVMVVRTLWPGATAQEVEKQVTERLEKKLQEAPWMHVMRSASRPGESLVFVQLKDYTPKKDVPDAWYQVRKKVSDMRHTLPQGAQGPFINDEFGDTFINLFALTGDGFTLPELRAEADQIAKSLYRVADVKKIEFFGVQDEKIFIDLSQAKLATLGLSPSVISDAIARQNTVTPSGFFETTNDRIRLRVNLGFSEESIAGLKSLSIAANGRFFRLGDLAKIYRGTVDPAAPRMRLDGQDAIGFGIVMSKGGDVIHLGDRLRAEIARQQARLPVGMDIHVVADQPEVVEMSLSLFIHSLGEAVAIVLAVSFLSLGVRTGTVVALTIPLVLAITFLLMYSFGIDLQRISLGALIIALGLLVDDAIIAVEMMVVKMEQGWSRFDAATFAFDSTAFPMLTGTLVTAAGFMPVGFARSAAGEYTFSIFAVVTIALLVSWVVAVLFTPYLGYKLLDPVQLQAKAQLHGEDIYDTPFYRRVRGWVETCVRHRRITLMVTAAAFVIAVAAFASGVVKKQFFPVSSRPELLIDLWLPQGASLKATQKRAEDVEKMLAADADVKQFATYVGNGSPRFYLPLDQQLFNDNFAQFVITPPDIEARERLRARLQTEFAREDGAWSDVRPRVLRLENGPPVGYAVQFRVSGENLSELRRMAEEVAVVMRANPHTKDVHFDWNDQVKQIRLELDHDRARAMGVSALDISSYLNTLLNGQVSTQVREADQLIDVVLRASEGDRNLASRLASINIHAGNGKYVPLAQLVKIHHELEEGVVWRRNRFPTMTVRADVQGALGPEVSKEIESALAGVRDHLPSGMLLEMGGEIEESATAENSIKAVMPLMLMTVITLLMVQLQSMARTFLVLLTAPLGLIGVAISLVLFNQPFGFVANLGVIALMGMIMRNSVILVDQIEQDERAGKSSWEAIIGSAVRRFRPIMLTAAAAILAMIPLTRSVFWGPMAVAIMGGLLVATVLTLLFLPALYAAWYKVRE
ncbi:MAG: hypothetical protein RIR18_2017 [Pseudomonadota bacterium]